MTPPKCLQITVVYLHLCRHLGVRRVLEEPLKELNLSLNLSPSQEEDWQVSDMGLHHYGLLASTSCLTALLVEHLLCEMMLS